MLTKTLRATLIAAAVLGGLTTAANAARPIHHDDYCPEPLPRFGMHSYNNGYGEVIVSVRHGGLACQLGLEEGDVVERLNHHRLTYHGSWERALSHAMANGGHIELRVRDTHSGRLVHRHIDLDPYGHVVTPPVGPITPKVVVVNRPVIDHYPAPPACGTPGPITPKHHVTPKVVRPRVVAPRIVQPKVISPRSVHKAVNFHRAVEHAASHGRSKGGFNLKFGF